MTFLMNLCLIIEMFSLFSELFFSWMETNFMIL